MPLNNLECMHVDFKYGIVLYLLQNDMKSDKYIYYIGLWRLDLFEVINKRRYIAFVDISFLFLIEGLLST